MNLNFSPHDYLATHKVERPKILISGCLAGQAVRYDGGHKSMGQVLATLSQWLDLITHCPEVDAGLGTPRPPVQLVQVEEGKIHITGVNEPTLRVDQPLLKAAESWCQKHSGFSAAILKARSPSCGSGTTPIYTSSGQPVATADGIFTEALKRKQGVVVVDESYFSSEEKCGWFVLGNYLQQGAELEPQYAQKIQWEGDLNRFLETTPTLF